MSIRTLKKILMLAIASAVIPACGSSEKNAAPFVIFASPNFFATGVPRCPVIYLRFDRALDPSTVNPSTIFLDSPTVNEVISVSYNAALFEVRIVPNTDLEANKQHQIMITPAVKSATGIPSPGDLIYFTTDTPGSPNRPAFGGLTTVTPATTSIDLGWAAATDPDAGTVTYDIAFSTVSGGEDLTNTPHFVTITSATISGLTPATQYFFKVRARNGSGNMDINNVEMSGTTLP